MTWNDANQKQPKPFARVWIKTSNGRQTTGYVDSSGQWVINCPRIRATGAKVLRWKNG